MARREDRGALSGRPAERRALRELLHQGRRPGGGRAHLDPPHDPPASRAKPTGLALADLLRRDAPGPAGDQGNVRRRPSVSAPDGAYIRIGDSELGPGRAHGRRSPATRPTRRWDLTFTGDAEPLRHLPASACTGAAAADEAAQPPSRRALHGHGRDRRRDDRARRLAGDGRPQLGRRARRALGLDPGVRPRAANAGDYLDIAAGRIKIGPMTTPWIANGRLVLDGEQYTARRPRQGLRNRDRRGARRLRVHVPGKNVNVQGQRRRARRRTSSPGSTPTPAGPSTTRSTARSPTSS